MKCYRLPRHTLILWQVRALSVTAPLSICLLFLFKMWGPIPFMIGVVTLWAAGGIIIWFYLPRLWQSFIITVGEGAVRIKRGRIFINFHILPFLKTVYTLSFQTPLAKKIGFAGLMLKGPRSRIFIPELPKSHIDEIKNAVLGETA